MASLDENLGLTVESLMSYSEEIIKQLSHSESGMESLRSLIDAFNNKRITVSVFKESLQLLFDSHKKIKDEGEIRDNHVSEVRAKVDENPKKSGLHVRIRVRINENPKEDVSEGKKRGITHSEPIEKTVKKQRKSRRLGRVTPSYKLIPEEQQLPLPNNPHKPELNCLNNKYSLVQFNVASGHKKQTKYEEAIERCEDEMFETDMWIGAHTSAVENAEKVIAEEMSVEDLGVKFYRCIQGLYRRDMSKTVREDPMKALPVILIRLKKKLDELTDAQERRKAEWKRVIEENTRKQREATRKN
ncbi:unnamed protein product [Eruca vesicaria subsp. sativa]|uniref:Histone deacetylase interacting domain-containing protein n=1 Tax=Eruca vesicaria subsp. sativa TaxID=29727 RepID=A0ABC8L920_ERUVS|nr:unnamed protein product [Eruca vesicaria subsp. sativa]